MTFRKPKYEPPRRAILEPPSAESFGLSDLAPDEGDDAGISLESMLQRGRSPGEAVPVVLVTHETGEAAMRSALARIAELGAVLEPPAVIRIEPA